MASRVNRTPDRSSKFSYKGRSFKSAKERSEKRGGAWETIFKSGIDTWRPKEGDNQIRILPIESRDESDHYAVRVWTHDRIGPDNSQFVCPRKMSGKPCSICEKAKEAKDAGESVEAKELAVKEHWVCWIIDREDEENPKLYTMSATQDSNLVSICLNHRNGSVLVIDEPDKGFDVLIRRTGKALNTKYLFSVDRESTPVNEDEKIQKEILNFVLDNPVEDLLIIRPASYLKTAMIGSVEERDDELDEEEDERPRKRRGEEEEGEDEEIKKDRKRSKSKDEDEEDPLPDDDDEDEKPSKKSSRKTKDDDDDEEDEKSRRGKRGKTEEDDEEDEDDEEEDRPSKKSSKRGKKEEEDEDDETDDNEEEDVKPSRKKSSKKSEEEEEEEDDEDEDEKPKKRLGRR